ncbi:phage N-6-adenine-methyltransferase [Vibrio furnissii]|uniref:phage N-6-adenine-methyltransferase n=1 Tax=Vibrio furnissii TaxID=29494 RepID=UPI001EEAE7D4|nr:phage N-6-adenine-methyltransferase [Vibrio furnissii]
MNSYAKKLESLKAQPFHKPKEIGDQWQTPKAVAWGLFATFSARLGSIVLDIFADESNALLPNFYTAKDNALSKDLAQDLRRIGGTAAFANPPYSRPFLDEQGEPVTGMNNILDWCRVQRGNGAKIILLIKAATSEGWWPDDADFVQFIEGRITFEKPCWYRAEKEEKSLSAGFPSAVVIFDKHWAWESRPKERLRRDDLIAQGNVMIEMMSSGAANGDI